MYHSGAILSTENELPISPWVSSYSADFGRMRSDMTSDRFDSSKIDKNVQEMRDLLRSEILTIPLHDYSEARKFLDSMAVSVH